MLHIVFTMKTVFLLVIIVSLAYGESFNGFGVKRTSIRKFEVPDVLDTPSFDSMRTGSDVISDIPILSEWHDEFGDSSQRLIKINGRNKSRKESFSEVSEVAALFQDICRRCMISGDMTCVGRLCSFTSMLAPVETHKVEQGAFVTGVSMHGDLLCSLCKNRGDVECKEKFCEDPEREKNAEDSGVECMQGFCRWQKKTVVTGGYNNYYNAWWQPNNLIVMFDQFTRELASAYLEFYMATSKAMNVLG